MTLKELRISKNLTQQDASFICKIPLRTYKRLELDNSYINSPKYKDAFSILEKYVLKKKSSHSPYNILVLGAGYVGFSISILLSINNNVSVVDINEDKVNKINERKPIFKDKEIEEYLKNKKLNL